jgi:hypothetical protein
MSPTTPHTGHSALFFGKDELAQLPAFFLPCLNALKDRKGAIGEADRMCHAALGSLTRDRPEALPAVDL